MSQRETGSERTIRLAEMMYKRRIRKDFESAIQRMVEFNQGGKENPHSIVEELNTSLIWKNSPIEYVLVEGKDSWQIIGLLKD